ncbi:hypothetical protein CTI12_AA428520 [Artemisia annua]|uniref:Homologous recombination OB-fold protein OB-fold domain-containing protein n=1 Tax=Artemisia annua TaxID=35608 RepID=A0A2U1M293_ARTAN|nr:hypothetical protein CTI12_AA428520 [Artemisia annua]
MNNAPHESSENHNDEISGDNPVRIIPGFAGVYQRAKLRDIKSFIKKGKVDQVVAIIKSYTPNALGDLTVTLKDLSRSISGTIHHKIINEGGYGKDIAVGAALILRKISVFSLKSGHYLNITLKNLDKVFKKDTPPGGSGILSQEERMKLLEEEEMAEFELQLGGNVNDDEIH